MKAGWEVKRLGEVIEKLETVDPLKIPGTQFDYVDVSSVSNLSFQIEQTTKITSENAPSRARRKIRTNDVIFATIRPTLQRIAFVPPELDQQICSTGYMVLRANAAVLPKYLFHFLFSDEFSAAMESLQKGASYPAVTDGEVRDQSIPIPPLEEQKRIVAILDEAFEGLNRARAHTETNLQNARDLFEQTVANSFLQIQKSSDVKTERVAELANGQKGSIRTGPFGSQLLHNEFAEDGIAVLGIDNAVNNEFRWGKRRFISNEKYQELKRYTVYPGDVIITIMGTCGRCAIVPDDIPTAINTKHLCCISLDRKKCLPEYLHAYFLHSPKALSYLTSHASGSVMDGLNMGLIKDLPVDLPDIASQQKIADVFAEAKANLATLQSVYRSKLADLDALRQSLLQKAFAGELT